MKKFLSDIKVQAKILSEKSTEELSFQIDRIKKQVTFSSPPSEYKGKKAISTSLFSTNERANSTDWKKNKIIESIIPEWFALVQEVSFREVGLKHYDTQLLAGIHLHQGKVIEMKTGEGKTLASTLPISLNALSQKGVHVVTVNDYLAERDQKWMGKIYKGLNLSCGLIKSTSPSSEKRINYNQEITYVTNSELVFDYLRDSSALSMSEIVQRPFHYCIVDEIDSILIDEARTPLILSAIKGETNQMKLCFAKAIADLLEQEIDFQIDEKRRDLFLTEKGYQKVKICLAKKTLYDLKDPWILEILNALKAKYIFKLNKDYIVLNNKVLIVDEFTGRIMKDRRWSLGIHEAVETKEKVSVGDETKTKTSITYQNFFTLYPKLAGMTGTAETAKKEFKDIYNLDVVVIPTAKKLVRKDYPDLVYQTELSKWKAVLSQSVLCFQKGQPVLIGTGTVEKSEFLSDLFTLSKLPHKVLNAKPENVSRESEIIAQAGERGAITIATNMAGRGTDIILGGNPTFKAKQTIFDFFSKKNIFQFSEYNFSGLSPEDWKNLNEKTIPNMDLGKDLEKVGPSFGLGLENSSKNRMLNQSSPDIIEEYRNNLFSLETDILNLPYSLEYCGSSLLKLYEGLYQEIEEEWKQENTFVKNQGGLFVIGTERHETRRIDNQLRGRSGRQGDPGVSQFFVSLDDELVKVFGGENIRRWVGFLIQDENIPLQSDLLTKSLENAQKKVELYNYEIRKNVFQYDNILNIQRKMLFKARKEFLTDHIYHDLFLRYLEFEIDQSFLNQKLLHQKKKTNTNSRTFTSFPNLPGFKGLKNHSPIVQTKNAESKYLESLDFLTNSVGQYSSSLILNFYKENWISRDLQFAFFDTYEVGLFQTIQTTSCLSIIDFEWTEHIERMSYIRETINWRSYGQQNPLIEYNAEAVESLKEMFQQIRQSMLNYLINMRFIF